MARYYDPEVGVWTITDPAGQDFNKYGYCAGNPVLLVDQDGRIWGLIIGAAIGAVAGGMYGYEHDRGSWGWYALGGAVR